jgi:ABC-type nitrate/sulfonate/bicarbonate transport system substrate-binding protein
VLTKRFIREHPKAARKFVEGTARAIEWARQTPREQVIERLQRIWIKTGHGDPSILRYWHPPRGDVQGGVIKEKDFQVWIDWLVRDGQLKPGQVSARALYTNAGNPYAEGAKPGS